METNQKFNFHDRPVFTYTSELHAVDVVDGSDYADCNTGNPLHSYTGGLTTITLAAPGPIYFICPTEGHCQAGMKLAWTDSHCKMRAEGELIFANYFCCQELSQPLGLPVALSKKSSDHWHVYCNEIKFLFLNNITKHKISSTILNKGLNELIHFQGLKHWRLETKGGQGVY